MATPTARAQIIASASAQRECNARSAIFSAVQFDGNIICGFLPGYWLISRRVVDMMDVNGLLLILLPASKW